MDFLDYSREWVIKNIPEYDGIRNEVLELALILKNYKISHDRAITILKSLCRLLEDYKRLPSFYYMPNSDNVNKG